VNWPSDVNYVTACVLDRRVPKTIFAGVYTGGTSHGNPAIKIVVITDPKHPACGQRGLVATRALPKHTHVLDYLGFVTTDALCSQTSEYTLRLRDGLSGTGGGWWISAASNNHTEPPKVDAEKFGNEARFVNDYRGTGAARANVEFRLVEDAAGARMCIYTIADIRASVIWGRAYDNGACRAKPKRVQPRAPSS
jgi:hypothetical protein